MAHELRLAQVLAGAEQGGAENFFVRLNTGIQALTDIEQKAFIRGHEHRLESLRQGGVTVSGYRFGGKLNVLDSWRFKRDLTAFAPDVVMTWMGRATAATPPGDYALVARLGHYYNLKYYQHADYWVGISKGICQHLIDGGMPKDRVFHIPNFADESPVQTLPRDSFGTDPDKPLILAAGRLHVNKGFDTLFNALVDLADVSLWLAGSGPEEANLKALAVKLGIDARVKFLGWRTDVTALMESVDLFVCPSRHEGLGSIVMESFAHHCPIVATKSQGPAEVIEHDVTGLLCDIDDAGQLKESIESLLKDSDRARALASAAAEVYRSVYSRQVVVAQYHQLLQELKQKRS